jgi:hypothetical protein
MKYDDFNQLPLQLQRAMLKNQQTMHMFYSLSPQQRQDALDAICQLNSEKEMDDFIRGLS